MITQIQNVREGQSFKECDSLKKPMVKLRKIQPTHCVGMLHLETSRGYWCISAVALVEVHSVAV